MQITTNNHQRLIVDAYQLTSDERAEFSYIDWDAVDRGEASPTFVRYRGDLLDIGEFSTTHGMPDALAGWDGYTSDSAWSGLVLRFVLDDNDRVVIGRFFEG